MITTKEKIERAARDMAAENGLINLTRADLCKRVGIPDGSFHREAGQSFVDFVEELGHHEPFGGSEFVTRARAHPTLRKEHILTAAVSVSIDVGYAHVTRAQVAEAAGVSPALVTRYFLSMNNLRIEIMSYAVANEILTVIAQGLADGHSLAVTAPGALKRKAVKTLTS